MKVLITQSNYLPWKGYFDAINRADCFVVYDEMQYTRRDWRNRNRIKSKDGLKWLTIPVHNNYGRDKISEVQIAERKWRDKHPALLKASYGNMPYFEEVMEWLMPVYKSEEIYLSRINRMFINQINQYLEIETQILDSADFKLLGNRSEKLLNIVRELGADVYLTGLSARNYLDEALFEKAGVHVEYLDYSNYKEYPQAFGPFIHEVSIVDLLFAEGRSARSKMKTFESNEN